ncbi:lymphocyte antigen 6 complex locus protein G6c-like isoform X4 [Erpetoichthys calabaricus]|uniref:lymphocyte antigen 6 complex locus protein G6c-like isoform X4 n=1 Tax=Erpetoichthys calabaricus TaxID=27687 RepID=UPI00223412A8|nr:lymphocyte antigen 6 complex locus protein G6c-like isoform X4 [Erpetoichthys calabaricus]
MELFLVSLLFSLVCTVSSLTCHQCTPGTSLRCTETQKTCSPQETTCANAAVTTFVGGQSINVNAKDCATSSDGCGEVVSVNFLVSRVTVNVQCCNTDNCNTVSPPAYTDNNPNGLKCCVDENCQTTVQCLGKEDTCISAVVTSPEVIHRGCATPTSLVDGFNLGNVTCCDIRLCNDASSVFLNIIIFLLPLLDLKTFA